MAKSKRASDEFGASIDDIFGDGGIADIMSDIDDDDGDGLDIGTDDATGAPNALGGTDDVTDDGTTGGRRGDAGMNAPDGQTDGGMAPDTMGKADCTEATGADAGGGIASQESDDGELSFDDLRAADETASRLAVEAAAAREELAPRPLSKSAKRRRNKKRRQEQERAAAAATSAGKDAEDGGITHGTGHDDVMASDEAGDAYAGGDATSAAGDAVTDDGDGGGVPDGMEEVHLPEWALAIAAKRSAGVTHAFMLSGNVRDYMVRKVSVRDGLIGMLDPMQETFEVIATYDQASGLQFDLGDRYGAVTPDEYRKRYVRLMHEARKARGVMDDPDDDTIPSDPCELFEDIGAIFDMDAPSGGGARMLLFVDFLDMLCPEGAALQLSDHDKRLAITIADMCRSYKADAGGSCAFFLTDSIGQVNSTIRDTSNRVDQVIIPQPLTDARRDFVLNVLDVPENTLSDGRHVLHCEEGIDPEYLVVSTAGLACYQIEDIVLRSIADDEPVTAKGVKERKNEIIKNDYHGVLEIMDPKYGFEGLGGMEVQKRFFKDEVIDPIKKGELEAVPMGILMSGAAGTGKPLQIDTPIWRVNPNGMTPELVTIGDIKIGDYVYHRYGNPCLVINAINRGMMDSYKVTTKDGRSVICSADHIWLVKTLSETYPHERTVQEMLDMGIYDESTDGRKHRSVFYVPMNSQVEFPAQDLDIDPYVMGCFIGDGCCTEKALTLSSSDKFIVDEVSRIIGAKSVTKLKDSYSWKFVSTKEQLTDYNTYNIRNGRQVHRNTKYIQTKYFFKEYPEIMCDAGHKRIPAKYMTGSAEQRYALIQGLLDTDGCIVKDERYQFRGNINFSTTSKQLALDFRTVLFSLGIGSTLTVSDRRGQTMTKVNGRTYVRKSIEYRININCPNAIKPRLFRLPRKKERAISVQHITKNHNYEYTPIVSIEKLPTKMHMRCITVNMPDGLFLGGRDFLVCHNTVLAKAVAKESNMNCVALNMNSLFSDDSGHAERNLDRALECAMAMAPTIVFIDEIDEALPKRHTGSVSSISNHINKTMLTFLSDTSHRGKVIFLAASNFPEQIDPAMKRAGRFDKRIPMFAPTGYDRVRIIKISCGKAADANVNGDTTPYEMSCLYSPDKMLPNPFDVPGWLADGGMFDPSYAGDRVQYRYTITDRYGGKQECMVDLPQVLYDVIGKDRITLQAMYRAFFAVFTALPERGHDNVTNAVEDDDSYYSRIADMISAQGRLFGDDERVMEFVLRYVKYYDRIYSQFIAQTDHMTGAELDVVVQKAINLFRKWRASNAERQRKMMARGLLRSEKDIPWSVVYEACRKTTNSTAGVKAMEDNALLDTSDLDFIPDAIYGKRNKELITYKQRLSELRNQQM